MVLDTRDTINIAPEIFRAYDIRGIVDKHLTEDAVYFIGLAFGSEIRSHGADNVIMARDGRLSADRLSRILSKGLLDSGCDVIDIGAVPSPVLYFATHTLASESGVMLTASHNPADYNGMKFVLCGKTLSGGEIQALHQRIIDRNFVFGQGRLTTHDVIPEYLHAVRSKLHINKPFKIVLDCGNGICGDIAPKLFRDLGCKVIELYCDVDGRFPNHPPDPSELQHLTDLIDTVKKHDADLGLALDGDGDRLFSVTHEGEVILPDRLLMLFAKDILERQPNATIIYDVKSSRDLKKIIEEHGGKPMMSKTGHSFVKAMLKEHGAQLAGEMSGHTFFKERWYGFDDGLYTGARLLEVLGKHQQSLSDVMQTFPMSCNTPEIKLPIDESQKFTLLDQLQSTAQFPNADINTIDGLRVEFEDGWGLVRASNTSPYWILRFEAETPESLARIQKEFSDVLSNVGVVYNPDCSL